MMASDIRRRSTGNRRNAQESKGRWLDCLLVLLLIVSALVAYLQLLQHDFISYDDPEYVTDNRYVKAGLTCQGLIWALTSPSSANWFPVTWLSHMLDSQLFGMQSGMHHMTSLSLHILSSVLLFALLRRMTGSRVRSATVAFLFALHPLHVESVAWVAERKDVLSGAFCLIAIGAYLRYVEAPRPGRYAAVVLAFCLGLMSKPMVVTLPFMLLLLDLWPLQRLPLSHSTAETRARSLKQLIWEKTPLFVLSAVASVVTIIVQDRGGAVMSADAFPVGQRLGNVVISYVAYLGKLFWPANLSVFYPYPADLSAWQIASAVALLLGITTTALYWIPVRPYFAVGWFWFLGTLMPVIGLLQVGLQSRADRYTYLPSIGIYVLAVWGSAELCRRSRPARILGSAIAAAACSGCFAVTWQQVQYWRNSTSLFTHSLAVTSENWVIHTLLGTELVKEGRTEEGIVHLQKAVALNPRYSNALNNLGEALLKEGRNEDALRYLTQAVQLRPGGPEIHTNLGTILLRLNRVPEAETELAAALRLQPDSPEAHCELGLVYEAQGKMDAALAQLGESIRTRPDYADAHYNLGRILALMRRTDEAVVQFSEAIRIYPDHISAHYNLGTALAVQGKLAEAVSEFSTAVRLQPDYVAARNNLGSTLATMGKYDEAIEQFREALRLNPGMDEARRNLEYALALKRESVR